MIEFKLPDLGDGVDQGTVVNILVAEGDALATDQAVVEIEADKATLELPSPHAGKVEKVHIEVGDTVSQGDLVLTIAAAEGAEAPAPAEASEPTPAPAPAPAPTPEPVAAAAPAAKSGGNGASHAPSTRPDGAPLPAGPAVRRLARLMGVDLAQVSGSGQRGRITAEDVHGFLERKGGSGGSGGGGAAAGIPGLVLPPLPDFGQLGAVESEPLSGIRKVTVESMTRSWTMIPHVTNQDMVDITDLEAARKAFRQANPDVKLTMTVIVVKALASVLRDFPRFNSSLDLDNNQLIYKKFINIGVAVDTPTGLLVPVLKDVDKKSILQLAEEITDLAGRARDKKLKLEEMKGATFTVTNLGGIGGTSFTPIINWPEVAILGVSRASQVYTVSPDGPLPRLHMPLSLSYDHRVIDGADAARFNNRLGELLASPSALAFGL